MSTAESTGAGPIHIDLAAESDDICLSIADNGVGVNAKADLRSTGMGQRIVAAMAAKLAANVERDTDHAGTKIVVRFPRAGKTESRPGLETAG